MPSGEVIGELHVAAAQLDGEPAPQAARIPDQAEADVGVAAGEPVLRAFLDVPRLVAGDVGADGEVVAEAVGEGARALPVEEAQRQAVGEGDAGAGGQLGRADATGPAAADAARADR